MATIAALALGVALVPAVFAEDAAKDVTLKGEVLDMACYIAKGATGEAHAKCAEACVKGGQPMGLLAEDGTVYLLFASHQDASAYEQTKGHAGKMVEISGKLTSRAGMKGIEVSAVKGV